MIKKNAPVKIAVMQCASARGNVEANLHELERFAGLASADGVDLLITPEMYISGYNLDEGIAEIAATQPLDRVGEIAARHQIGIVAGGPEQTETDGKVNVANSAWFFAKQGNVLARHRKVQLYGEVDRKNFVAGDQPVTVVDFQGIRVGILICFDVEYPEAVRAAAFAGADLMAVPTAQMEPFVFVNEHVIRVRAWENGVYVAYANQTGPDGAFEYVGNSTIASPLGEVVAKAGYADSALLTATIHPEVITQARQQSPYLAEVRRNFFF